MKRVSRGFPKIFFQKFLRDDRGQATVEYILLLSVTVLGASQLGKAILSVLDKAILKIGHELEVNLKTGRAPLGVWQN